MLSAEMSGRGGKCGTHTHLALLRPSLGSRSSSSAANRPAPSTADMKAQRRCLRSRATFHQRSRPMQPKQQPIRLSLPAASARPSVLAPPPAPAVASVAVYHCSLLPSLASRTWRINIASSDRAHTDEALPRRLSSRPPVYGARWRAVLYSSPQPPHQREAHRSRPPPPSAYIIQYICSIIARLY